jgi:putative heme-binding domain-containing protein
MRTLLILALISSPSVLAAAQRVPWTTSNITGSPDPPKPYHTERVFPKLQFTNPVELMPLGDTGKLMLLEVGGKLYTFDDDPNCRQADLAIDFQPLIKDFRRAFGVGCHPDFDQNRQIFVVYAGDPVARPDGTKLSRFVVSDTDPPTVDPDSEEILLTWPSGGHNGSAIRFDRDGLLYFSTGDGARPFPPDEYDVSQDLSDLRSTICRIDVDRREGDRPYAIPQDNPFINTPHARPEIWAYGFRNPWRFTIVPDTNQILCGDVGWELWELIYDVRRGGNYGWSIFEGPQPIRDDIKPGPTPIRKPLVAYPHAVGQSVTGGIVYRGDQHPELKGAYLYGDYVTGLLWGLRPDDPTAAWNPVLAETGLKIITFAESPDREPLIVDYDGGIYRLIKNQADDNPSDFPRQLSKTGLFKSTESLEPAPGVIPYQLAATAWQDGANSQYLIGVPGTETIRINKQQRSWQFPTGTVFAKTLSKEFQVDGAPKSVRMETQILHFDGSTWQPYSYAWNQAQTDATLVDGDGLTLTSLWQADESAAGDRIVWRYHNRAECRACHSRQNGGAAGFRLENLELPLVFDADEQLNQIEYFIDVKILDRPAPKNWRIQSMADPADAAADLQRRARSYLAANCAHCHCRGGGGTVALDLSFSNEPDQINAIDVAPTQGSFGIDDAKVIKPGDPYRSVLYYRLATSGAGHMPKIWTRDNDLAGLKLVHDWIASLGTPPTQPLSGTPAVLRSFAQLISSDAANDDRVRGARSGAADANPLAASLFERFLPPEERKQRLGEHIDAEKILAIKGNAVSGRELFLDSQSHQCNQCHRIAGSGKSVGPVLDNIASQRTREQLLESILDPSKTIEPNYNTYVVLTSDGAVITGLKIAEDKQKLHIRAADGKDHPLAKDEIESFKIQPQSIMPKGLAAAMTAQELADLLAFLSSLKSGADF